MEGEGNLVERRSEKAYFTFGRFQPPTLGHGRLIDELAKTAVDNRADAYVFVSSTVDKKKNPLTVFQKVSWLKHMFPAVDVRFINTTTCRKGFATVAPKQECKTIFAVIDVLRSAGYTEVTLCVGSDRVPDFTKMLAKFTPEGIAVHVLGLGGTRNETASNLSGMSGTKMREAALRSNVPAFLAGTGLPEDSARVLMGQVQAGMRGGKRTRARTQNAHKNLKRTLRRNRTRNHA